MPRISLPIALAARLAYLLIILLATVTGIDLIPDPGYARWRLRGALNPTVDARDAVDAARNLLLFAGWGVVWMVTAPARRLWRSVLLASLTGLGISIGVETVQLFSRTRFASVLDVMTNTAGALAGAIVVLALILLLSALRGRRSFVGVPAVIFAASYGAAVLFEALLPVFRTERVPHAWGGPLSRFSVAIDYLRSQPFSEIPQLELALFIPAGAFMVAALVEWGFRYRTAGIVTSVLAPIVFAGVQLARAFMGYPIQTGALFAHSAGAMFGALLTASALPALTQRLRGRHRPIALLVMYAILLAIWSWRPFLPVTDMEALLAQLSRAYLVPLRALSQRGDMFSVAIIGVQALLFAPLGALLAVWPLRARGALAHFLPAVYLSLVLEGGQLFVAGRLFDVTDVIVQSSCIVLAWLVVRRTGYRPHGELLGAPRSPPSGAVKAGH